MKSFSNKIINAFKILSSSFKNKMSAPIDCPICMDCIESTTKNFVTTECGHCFHANCLMTSIAHNGFGCPYCRAIMAEEPEDDDDDDDESTLVDDEDDETREETTLRGFRLFWNIVNDEEPLQIDILAEDITESIHNIGNRNANTSQPPVSYVVDKLKEQGFTIENIVSVCLEEGGYIDNEETWIMTMRLHDSIDSIFCNYRPEPEVQVTETQAPDIVEPLIVE